MSNDVKIEIGTSAEEMGQRFVDAWRTAERGEHQKPQTVLVFESLEAMLQCLSKPRLGVLKQLAKGAEPSIRSLAGHLKRDYSRVHKDVRALVESGLIQQDGTRLTLAARSAEARIDFDKIVH